MIQKNIMIYLLNTMDKEKLKLAGPWRIGYENNFKSHKIFNLSYNIELGIIYRPCSQYKKKFLLEYKGRIKRIMLHIRYL